MNIAICDDNNSYIDRLKELLQPYVDLYSLEIDVYTSGERFLASSDKIDKYDIIFMDIEMEEISGVDVAREIRESGNDVIIIFVTSHVRYVSDTFRLGAFQFLVKPIDEKAFAKDFERAIATYRSRHHKYIVSWYDTRQVLECSEIYSIESYNRHLFIHTQKGGYECVGKLDEEYEKLKMYNFSRCHQSYIVNMSKVQSIETESVILKNGTKVPVSRRQRAKFMEDFNWYIAGKSI